MRHPRLMWKVCAGVLLYETCNLASGQCVPRAYSIGLGMRVAPAVMVHPVTGDLWLYGSAWASVYTDTWVRHEGYWSLAHTGGPALGQLEFDPVTQAPLMVTIPSYGVNVGQIQASRWTGDSWHTETVLPPQNRI